MIKKSKAGTQVVEFSLYLTSFMMLSIGLLSAVLFVGARSLMMFEAYSILRAKLYQNSTACNPNTRIWPTMKSFSVSYSCSSKNLIAAEMRFSKMTVYKNQIQLGRKNK